MTISPEAIKSKSIVPDSSKMYSFVREDPLFLNSTSTHLPETKKADISTPQNNADDTIDLSISLSNNCEIESENKNQRRIPTLIISAGDSLLTTAEHSPLKDKEDRSKDLFAIEEPYLEKETSSSSDDDASIAAFTDSGTGTIESSSPAEFHRDTEDTVVVAKARPFLAVLGNGVENMKSMHEPMIDANGHTLVNSIFPSYDVQEIVIDSKIENGFVPTVISTEINDNLTVLSNRTLINQLSNPQDQRCDMVNEDENENENEFSTEQVITIESYVIANHLKFLMKWTSDNILNSDSTESLNPLKFPFIDLSTADVAKKKINLIYESASGVSSMMWKFVENGDEEENMKNETEMETEVKKVVMKTDSIDNNEVVTANEGDIYHSSIKLVIDTKTKIHLLTVCACTHEEAKKRSKCCDDMITLLGSMNYRLPLQGEMTFLLSFSSFFSFSSSLLFFILTRISPCFLYLLLDKTLALSFYSNVLMF